MTNVIAGDFGARPAALHLYGAACDVQGPLQLSRLFAWPEPSSLDMNGFVPEINPLRTAAIQPAGDASGSVQRERVNGIIACISTSRTTHRAAPTRLCLMPKQQETPPSVSTAGSQRFDLAGISKLAETHQDVCVSQPIGDERLASEKIAASNKGLFFCQRVRASRRRTRPYSQKAHKTSTPADFSGSEGHPPRSTSSAQARQARRSRPDRGEICDIHIGPALLRNCSSTGNKPFETGVTFNGDMHPALCCPPATP